jgi:hypothetical protein
MQHRDIKSVVSNVVDSRRYGPYPKGKGPSRCSVGCANPGLV